MTTKLEQSRNAYPAENSLAAGTSLATERDSTVSSTTPDATTPDASARSIVSPLENARRRAALTSTTQTIQQLQRQIRAVETGKDFEQEPEAIPTGITSGLPAIDRLLPDQGYRRGSLVEWLTPGNNTIGYGADLLSLQLAQRAAEDGGTIVIVDPTEEFYPVAARTLGIELHRLVILRGQRLEDLYWSIDQALRCSSVSAVWAAASPALPRFLVDMDERWHRRFQLSVEASGAIGLFLRPEIVARQPTWSDIQWHIKAPASFTQTSPTATAPSPASSLAAASAESPFALPEGYHSRPVAMQLLRCRGGRTGHTVHFQIDSRTGALSPATSRRRSQPTPATRVTTSRFRQTG
ncbi:MAG: hypothetical protein R3C03_22775 [Pirellulaceae bacterium]